MVKREMDPTHAASTSMKMGIVLPANLTMTVIILINVRQTDAKTAELLILIVRMILLKIRVEIGNVVLIYSDAMNAVIVKKGVIV